MSMPPAERTKVWRKGLREQRGTDARTWNERQQRGGVRVPTTPNPSARKGN